MYGGYIGTLTGSCMWFITCLCDVAQRVSAVMWSYWSLKLMCVVWCDVQDVCVRCSNIVPRWLADSDVGIIEWWNVELLLSVL